MGGGPSSGRAVAPLNTATAANGTGVFVLAPQDQWKLTAAQEREWAVWGDFFVSRLKTCPFGSGLDDEPEFTPLGIGSCFACVRATLEVHQWPAELPEELQVGLWRRSGEVIDAFTRFSCGTANASRIAFQLDDGLSFTFTENMSNFILADEVYFRLFYNLSYSKGTTLTAMLNPKNWPRIRAMLAFKNEGGERSQRQQVLSHPYYSMTPYRCGPGCVKYALRPKHPTIPFVGEDMATNRPFMREHIRHHALEYELCIQVARDPVAHPIEDALVVWDEDISPYVPVATLRIPAQDPDALNEVQNLMAFHSVGDKTPPEHAALGTINMIRNYLYKQLAPVRISHVHGLEHATPLKCPFH